MGRPEIKTSAKRAAFDLTESNVDPENPIFLSMLNDLQANIIKGHGRKFAYHIFLQLQVSRIGEAKQWIARFAGNRITSALKLEEGLLPGGSWALIGVTMAPGFDPADYVIGERRVLLDKYPEQKALITALTPTKETK